MKSSPMSPAAIRTEGLSKRYRITAARHAPDTAAAALTYALAAPFRNLRSLRGLSRFDPGEADVLWALRDVSFELREGQILGVIGRNGAGKSTLLKILSRITEPTSGQAMLRGRVGSLLEVGTGFHPDLTGRENVYLNGSILGMDRGYINRRFDEIVAFSGVARHIDTPVKRYSSGMYLRLAFAVAAHLEPDILLVDEVLAVGDAEFQRKCLGKMGDVARSGRTVLLVSHNMAAIGALADSVLLLERGELTAMGDPATTISAYLRSTPREGAADLVAPDDRRGDGRTRLTTLRLLDDVGNAQCQLVSGRGCTIELTFAGDGALRAPEVRATIYSSTHQPLLHFDSTMTGDLAAEVAASTVVRLEVPRLPLARGRYAINVSITANGDLADHVEHAAVFDVLDGQFFASGRNPRGIHEVCLVDHQWSIGSAAEAPTC